MATNPTPLQAQTQGGPQPDPNNLPRELWYPIWQLLVDLERIDDIPRREEVKLILQRRLYMRGEQYWWYDNSAGAWYPPNMLPAGFDETDTNSGNFKNVTNIFQATGLSLSSVITQNNTRAQFFPAKASDPQDVSTAKNASKFTDQMHRKNDWPKRMDEAGYFMCTDGFFGAHVRYVSDGDKFGHDERDILSPVEVPIGPATVSCPSCGYEAEGSLDTQPTCPDCGQPTQENPPPTATGLETLGTLQIPKGQEVVSIVPALQIRRTAYADEQSDFLYMDWVTDIDKSVAIATYPEKEDLLSGTTGGDDAGTAASYERIARRLLYLGTGRHSGVTLEGLGTFQRAWIRPKAFYRITDKVLRAQYLQMYPKGVKIVFYNGQYCESKAESMDEAWESMQTMPGEGSIRETLISSILPIQDQLNDCTNLLFEICMNGVPEGFAATDLFDIEARNEQVANAGNITPVTLAPNQDIRQKMQFTQAVEPSMAMMKYIDMLMNAIPQFLSGNYPALFGGDTGSNDTAAGIAIQRNQAMGRIGRVWRNFQQFLANVDAKAVKCFANNRTEDMEVAQQGDTGEFDTDFVRLEDMQGNIVAFPEVDAQFPVLEADVRALLLNMFNGGNPIFLQTVATPENLEYTFRMLGISDIQVPGEQQRKKTNLDIAQLSQEQPQPGQPGVGPDGKPTPPQPVPSIVPDPNIDDLKVAAATAKAWLISDKGLQVKQANPAGYINVYLFSKACAMMEKQQEMQQAVAAMALQDQGPLADAGGAGAMLPPPHLKPAEKNPPKPSSASGSPGAGA